MLRELLIDIPNSKALSIITPILRKNRRVENRWGLQYEVSVQYAAFGRQCVPYMPTEPPASLSEEIMGSEPLYVCEECKDCFRFQSSLEDHYKRRSWIFGLWCHTCFRTVCTHITETGSTCSICMKKDNEKRKYLRSRGYKHQRFQKWGVIKVFYNQCQLYEHMKLHGLCSIDVSDIMLMPLPTDLTYNDWTPELEIACEALMEYTFLLHVHIMDWLRMNKLINNWWKLTNDNDKNNDNIISKVVKGYKGRQIFKTFEKSEDDQDPNSNVTLNVKKNFLAMEFVETTFNDKDKNNYSANAVSDKNVSENEDNPCTDIAFVDCGPASKCLEPEPSMSYIPKKQIPSVLKNSTWDVLNLHLIDRTRTNRKRKKVVLKDFIETDMILKKSTTVKVNEKSLNKSTISKQLIESSSQKYRTEQSSVKETAGNSISKPIIETDIAKILNNPIKIDVPFPAKNVKLPKANSDHLEHSLHTSTENCDSKILTVQSSKKADVTSIINDLPSQHISNTNEVVLEQNLQRLISLSDKDVMIIGKMPNKSVNSSTDTSTSSQNKQVGPFLIKDGKKYLIKHSESIRNDLENSPNLSTTTTVSKGTIQLLPKQNISTSTSINSAEIENISTEQATSLHNDISLLTPSPSPSELSSGSSCESHIKKTLKAKLPRKILPRIPPEKTSFEVISLVKEENGENLYMNIKIIDRAPKEVFHDMCKEMFKHKQKMMEEFCHLDNYELMRRITHLNHVTAEIKNSMNFVPSNIVREKLKSVDILKQILESYIRKRDTKAQNKKKGTLLEECNWERTDLHEKCPSCRKPMKPKSYIAGFSKLSDDDEMYCFCYKYICHQCQSYHGTSSRFIAHQNFHMKKSPYICPDCENCFIEAKFLEIHIWTHCFHMSKKRILACKICEIDGFKDIESITTHFAIMHCITKVACEICCLVFSSNEDCMKHYVDMHTNISLPEPIRLVMSKLNNKIVRYEKFMSYLDEYPAIKELIWYKCPFCPMVIVEHIHAKLIFSAHLRDKHWKRLSEIISEEVLADTYFVTKFGKSSITGNISNTFVNAPLEDGTVIPRIINARTISSEIFERGSHDTGNTWTISPDKSASTIVVDSSQVVSSSEKVESLPKILNVRSIADLKAVAPKNVATSTKTVTEMEVVCDSQASQSEVMKTTYKKEDLLCKDTRNNLIDIKSVIEEQTKVVEESHKNNDESITSCAAEPERSLQTKDVRTNSPIELSREISNSESVSKTSTSGSIKVVDIRKICKPNIEPFVEEPCDIQSENENATCMSFIPKPPPLSKIPQHALDYREVEETYELLKDAKSKSLFRRVAKKRQRIAIIGPTDTQEGTIEFLCHICNEKINTSWPILQMHFTENHSHEYQLVELALRLTKLPSDFMNHYKKLMNTKKRKSDVTLSMTKRKRRWTPKKHTEIKDTSVSEGTVGLCVNKETAEDGEGNFKCKKCSQRCTDMSDLREHIATNHRLKGRYLICLECGENFVVAPSLQMHLKAFHGIEDPISYMNQNPSYAPDVNNYLQAEGKTTIANQCYVCMAVFEDKAAVDKHLRVHGMAFLNRKMIEARNALKSPEKKPNTEEKQSPVTESLRATVRRDKPVETLLEKLLNTPI
ncbi:PREDICTED: uncharacterized protein LOC106741150 isoform X2 [Dinoponera quadriceps]|uniref:Uncharacterized protein LOC106741150 isoform X2 n=1 Tax=Dinoponera quadriceps TaxID=609295 RepID=A0A6P3WR67_DINQU|nr:PREDICTED: uncharacterized protein LOC106741150 isoform X2 [Dinoponera quadriceps]